MSKVLVVGGGAAGMFAAIFAAKNGHTVHLYEKNEKLGKKIFITGKGRCNVTNACDIEDLFTAVVSNPKFLYSGFYSFTNQDVMDFFEDAGVPLKIERGNRVFPVSDHSSDIIRALERTMKQYGVSIHLNAAVTAVKTDSEQAFSHIQLKDGTKIYGDSCIIATGGISYPLTGSTGDGHEFAKKTGHKITPMLPALVPLKIKEDWITQLQGLSLRNVKITITNKKKKLYEDFGEMLFTHYGVSGPVILSASSMIGNALTKNHLQMCIDLKPGLSEDQLDQRIIRDFEENKNKQFKNALNKLFPSKLIPVMVYLSNIDGEKKVNEISREERKYFVSLIKNLPVTITGLRSFQEAIITKGGISVKDVNPQTMESKLAQGLYFCGEILDLDAVTGGYNLQIAWSTGYLAGISIN